jgi:nucleotide-binding universal stress UspA family protein
MFATVVVATDLSEASDQVVRCLDGLRVLGTRRVILAHAVGVRHLEEIAHLLVSLAEPKLAQQKATVEALGFEAAVEIGSRTAMVEVNRIAGKHQASLIVVGSLGATCAREVLLGGTALAIVHHAKVPVLVVRLRVSEPDAQGKCQVVCADFTRHVLYPTDFSDNAEHAFSYVRTIAECGAQRVTLLHVQDKGKIDPHLKDRLQEFNRIDTERLERLKAELVKRGVRDVRIELPYGVPKKEIIERTAQDDVSLVVMGTQGRGYVAELFLGSVSHAVARHSQAPVLLIPAIR